MPDAWKHNIWFWLAAICAVAGVTAQWGPDTIQVLRDGEQQEVARPAEVLRENPPEGQVVISPPASPLLERSPVQLASPESVIIPGSSAADVPGVVTLADSSTEEGVVRLGVQSPAVYPASGAHLAQPTVRPRESFGPTATPTPNSLPAIRSRSNGQTPPGMANPVRLTGIQPLE